MDTDVYELIREYRWLQAPGEAPQEYHDVLARHAQRLSAHRGLFFGLLRHEGSACARERCDKLVRSGRWYKQWIRTEQVGCQHRRLWKGSHYRLPLGIRSALMNPLLRR